MSTTDLPPENVTGTPQKEDAASELEKNLRHCFAFDHLTKEQGIAILLGLMPEPESIHALRNYYSEREDPLEFIRAGIPLINGNVVGGSERHFRKHSGTSGVQDVNEVVDEGKGGSSRKNHSAGKAKKGTKDTRDNGPVASFEPDPYKLYLMEQRDKFYQVVDEFDRLLGYFKSGVHGRHTPLPYFVSWASGKNFRPGWLADAISLGLYKDTAIATGGADKPLDPRERRSLLIIIAALCDSLKIDPKSAAAAKKIVGLVEQIGLPISGDTVRRHLREMVNYLEDQGK